MTDMLTIYRERARRGAVLLDAAKPDWRALVQKAGGLSGGDMYSMDAIVGCCGCVLGRTYGDVHDGLKWLQLRADPNRPVVESDAAVQHGFTLDRDTCAADTVRAAESQSDWELLAQAWRELIWLDQGGTP